MAKTTKTRLNPNFVFLENNVPQQRWTLLQGSTRSGKTYSIIDYIIKLCLHSENLGLEIDIVRDTFKALKATAWKDFQHRLVEFDLYDVRNHNRTDHCYNLNGNLISYYGTDDPEKVHGRKRDILWLNECNQIEKDTLDQLTVRTSKRIIGDYNPALGDDHWLDPIIQEFPPLITTYKDNPFLTKEQVLDIESKKDQPYWWSVYGLGIRAKREGVIFQSWEEGEFDESLPYHFGLDFGYKADPDACDKVAIDEKKKILYIDEQFHEYGQSTDELAGKLRQLSQGMIIADSAEARLIDDLRMKIQRGIQAVKKYPGSVLHGIRLMENYKIVVTPRSKNVMKELNNYAWATKGKELPIDDYNHHIDNIRYVVLTHSNREFKSPDPIDTIDTRFNKGLDTGSNSTPW